MNARPVDERKSPGGSDTRRPPARHAARRQFNLASLMLVLTVVSAMGAAASYLMRSLQGEGPARMVFIFFCLAGPPLLLILVSRLWLSVRHFQRAGRRRPGHRPANNPDSPAGPPE